MVPNGEGDHLDWPQAVAGDHDAFGRVFDRHADLIYRFARRRTGDPSLAEDITAQVFLEAWRQRSKVGLLDGSLAPWLLGVAGNLVRRHWRTLDRKKRALARLSRPRVPDHADVVVAHLENEGRITELRARLATLPPRQLDVLLLWAWEELSYAEIGLALDIPIGTVRSRLSRARIRLGDPDGTAMTDRECPDRKPTEGDLPVFHEGSDP